MDNADVILVPALQTIFILLNLYVKVVFAAVIVSWLIALNILNLSNRIVAAVYDILERLTAPVFKLFRRLIPPVGGLDISPIFVLIFVQFLQNVIIRILMRL